MTLERKPFVIATDLPAEGESRDEIETRAASTGAWIAWRHKVVCGALGEQVYVEGGADDEGIAAQIAELHSIARDLANTDPMEPTEMGPRLCRYCDCVDGEPHDDACLWERARKATER